jgi:hypothetical protein
MDEIDVKLGGGDVVGLDAPLSEGWGVDSDALYG